MRFIVVRDTDTPDELAEAIRNLRARQERCELAEVRAELSADIDELVDLYLAATKVGR